MEVRNQTSLKEFIFVGFSQNMKICMFFFSVLLLMYIFTVFGNLCLIVAVLFTPKLHLPMYYFLWNLSFIDLCCSSCILPEMLKYMFSRRRTISVTACLAQMNIGIFLGNTECLLLAVMAYDRYCAIRLPLYYSVIMNWKTCRNIIIIMWLGSFFISVVPCVSRPLIFCTANKLDHFVCEILAVLELACGNLAFYKLTISVVSLFTLVLPLVFIVGSYILIIASILKIRSTDGRSKAFSTCTSHLTVVSMFYGTNIIMYMDQSKRFSSHLKYFFLMYGIVTPALNPLIYSLRNNDVKEAIRGILTKCSPEISKYCLLFFLTWTMKREDSAPS